MALLAETLWLTPDPPAVPGRDGQRTLFPMPDAAPANIVRLPRQHTPPGWRKVVQKVPDSGNDYFQVRNLRLEQPASASARAGPP